MMAENACPNCPRDRSGQLNGGCVHCGKVWLALPKRYQPPSDRQAHIDAATAAGLSLSDYLRERGLT